MSLSVDLGVIASRVISLPRAFWDHGNKSMFSLLKDSGYFETNGQISMELFQSALLKDRRCIQDWLQYSNDKRTSSGWYFNKVDPGRFVVGFVPEQAQNKKKIFFNDPFVACANYVMNEIEYIRGGGA